MNDSLIKRVKIIIFFINFLIISHFLYGLEDTKIIQWGISSPQQNIYTKKRVELFYEQGKPVYYRLKKNIHKIDKYTDLYLSFDKNGDYDDTGKYKFLDKKMKFSKNQVVYKQAAFFITNNDRVELIGAPQTLFQSKTNIGNFTISFWIYPATFSDNEIILKIGSKYYNKKKDIVEEQSIVAKINDGKLVWQFNNVFGLNEYEVKKLELQSFNRISPEKWNHICLTYNSFKGIIREYINGIEEGILVSTKDGTLESSVLNLRYHPTNRCIVVIGPTFRGGIDEFFILSKEQKTYTQLYDLNGGELISNVYNFGSGGIFIDSIIPQGSQPNKSQLIYYYRYSKIPFNPDYQYNPNDGYPTTMQWKIFGSEELEKLKFRFFQWKVLFLPGENGNYSPRFRDIKIVYRENKPPSKPIGLKIVEKNHKFYLSWLLNSEKDVKGYKIYYGTRSGNYFCNDAKEGESPIDIGLRTNFTISNLGKNKIYYFTITAYDDEDEHIHESPFSDEVTLRFLDK